jgi:hypothetical protein
MPPEPLEHSKISMKNNITLTIIRIRSQKIKNKNTLLFFFE